VAGAGGGTGADHRGHGARGALDPADRIQSRCSLSPIPRWSTTSPPRA
jgi:hypothetical protein